MQLFTRKFTTMTFANRLLYLVCSHLPLSAVLKLMAAVDQLHVEVRRADEGQAGYGCGADQVQDAAETRNRLGNE